MNLNQPGANTFLSEVTNIAGFGFWLLVNDKEYFVPFADYPVFRTATVSQIYNMQQLAPGQFHCPELDVDIELAALQSPKKFTLAFHY